MASKTNNGGAAERPNSALGSFAILMTIVTLAELLWIVQMGSRMDSDRASTRAIQRMLGVAAHINQEKRRHPESEWAYLLWEAPHPFGVFLEEGMMFHVVPKDQQLGDLGGVDYVISAEGGRWGLHVPVAVCSNGRIIRKSWSELKGGN